jgi:hypothetical protein
MVPVTINGVNVVTTDTSVYSAHISCYDFSILKELSSGKEGQMLIWKNGLPKWVDMPTNFQTYFNQINK